MGNSDQRQLIPHKLGYNLRDIQEVTGYDKAQILAFRDAGVFELGCLAGTRIARAKEVAKLLAYNGPPPEALSPEKPHPPLPKCGVYLLKAEGRVVYVGRSTNMRTRLSGHRRSGRPFDEYEVIACDARASDWLERELIRTLRPEQNVTRYARHTREIGRDLKRAGLG